MEFRLGRKSLPTSLALTAVFNSIISLFLTHLGFGGGFLVNFIFSRCIGLANVKERLDVLFHGKGRLILEDNQPSGLRAIMEIPHE